MGETNGVDTAGERRRRPAAAAPSPGVARRKARMKIAMAVLGALGTAGGGVAATVQQSKAAAAATVEEKIHEHERQLEAITRLVEKVAERQIVLSENVAILLDRTGGRPAGPPPGLAPYRDPPVAPAPAIGPGHDR